MLSDLGHEIVEYVESTAPPIEGRALAERLTAGAVAKVEPRPRQPRAAWAFPLALVATLLLVGGVLWIGRWAVDRGASGPAPPAFRELSEPAAGSPSGIEWLVGAAILVGFLGIGIRALHSRTGTRQRQTKKTEMKMETLDKTQVEPTVRTGVSPMWRVLAIILIVALVLGGIAVALALARGDGDAAESSNAVEAEFPTGTFVRDNGSSILEFNEDGTGASIATNGSWEVPFTYAVNGNLYTEMTFDYPGLRKVPATYYWSYDGEHLTFELWGEDVLAPSRYDVYADPTWTKAED